MINAVANCRSTTPLFNSHQAVLHVSNLYAEPEPQMKLFCLLFPSKITSHTLTQVTVTMYMCRYYYDTHAHTVSTHTEVGLAGGGVWPRDALHD